GPEDRGRDAQDEEFWPQVPEGDQGDPRGDGPFTRNEVGELAAQAGARTGPAEDVGNHNATKVPDTAFRRLEHSSSATRAPNGSCSVRRLIGWPCCRTWSPPSWNTRRSAPRCQRRKKHGRWSSG